MPKIDIVNAKNIIESNPEKAFFKLKNTGGPKGDTGAQGPQGPKGDTGAQGPAGASASVTVGSTTTLSPGADATVTNSGDTRNAILNFGIPTGAQGPQGIQGPKGDTGPMGQTGAKGDTGAAATVQVGNTNTGAPGTNAQVTNAGNEHFAVFNFTIPRGDKGETGATGAQGPKGDKGDKGDAGQAATVTVGSTTTTNPGTSATVTNSGTTSAAVLNFGIPRGATGSVKSEVVSELPETGEGDTFYLVNREATTQTATGKTINFTNSENAGDITNARLNGETSQTGTPTPDAPVPVQTVTGENVVKICGKNLINFSSFQQSWDGASLDGEGTTITMSPNTSGSMGLLYDSTTYSVSIPAGRMITWSRTWAGGGTWESGAFAFPLKLTYSDGTTETLSFGDTTERNYNQVISVTKTLTKSVVSVKIESGGCFGITNLSAPTSFSVQLELGSTATAYEPYQGQSYEINLGKNLFDKDNSAQILNNIYIHAQGMGTNNGFATVYIPCDEGAVYTISKALTSRFSVGTTVAVPAVGVSVSSIVADNSATKMTYTTGAGSRYLVVQVRSASDTLTVDEIAATIQIQKGSQATSYAAYFEPIELCKIGDYQDYIYKSGDKWYKHAEIAKIACADISWVWDGTIPRLSYNASSLNVVGPVSADTAWLAYSNKFEAYSFKYVYTQKNTGMAYSSSGFISLVDITWADQASAVASVQDCFIYYVLATPTDTEITNQALVAQLDNVASAPLYAGVNNITTITPNEQGTLEIKYVTYDKYNQNKVYIWNDTLQQWQIIVP
jgi:hypothetical protein